MFGLTPKAPIDSDSQTWIKSCYDYFIANSAGINLESIVMVLPTKEFFPENIDGSFETANSIMKRICTHMGIESNNIILNTFKEHKEEVEKSLSSVLPSWSGNHSGAAGYYSEEGYENKVKISIKRKIMNNPIALIATLSHELAHYVLLNLWKFPRENNNMEPITDLLTIFSGMGIFIANSAIQFNQWQDYQQQGWSVESQGYLTQETIGYALAEWALRRKETNPGWLKYLCTDVKSYCKQSIKYLNHHSPANGNRNT